MIYVILLAINLVLLIFIKPEEKYLMIPLMLLIIFVMTFFLWRFQNNNKFKQFELSYRQSAKSKPNDNTKLWKQIVEHKISLLQNTMIFIHAIALQTFLTFIIQTMGYFRTPKKKLYKSTSISFGILVFLILILEFMLGIVPTGGIIG